MNTDCNFLNFSQTFLPKNLICVKFWLRSLGLKYFSRKISKLFLFYHNCSKKKSHRTKSCSGQNSARNEKSLSVKLALAFAKVLFRIFGHKIYIYRPILINVAGPMTTN